MDKKSKKELLTFGLASFFNDIGSDLVAPIWPIFVKVILGANMTVLGFLDGLGIALVSVSNAFSGWLSDKLGKRKLFIYVGYLLSGLARVGYFISPSWHYLAPFKAIDRVGKIRGAPRDALVTELSKKSNRGASFGILRSLDSLGAVTGTIIAYLIISFVSIRNILLIAAVPSVLSALIVFLFVKDRRTEKLHTPLSKIRFNKNLKIFFIISMLFSFATLSYSFLIVFAEDYGFSESNVILLYLLFNIIYTIFSYQFGKLADKKGRKFVVVLAMITYFLMCAGFLMVSNAFIVLILFVLFGLFNAAFDPVKRTFIADLAPKDARGSVLGGYEMFTGLIALPSGVLMGYLWDFNPSLPFITAGGMTLVSVMLMGLIKEKRS
ncbi:MAG: MFS transporter [Nanoarchaeota archaeon]|nr:MFS transporter [Nanoarchaeota archaeon]